MATLSEAIERPEFVIEADRRILVRWNGFWYEMGWALDCQPHELWEDIVKTSKQTGHAIANLLGTKLPEGYVP